MTKQKQKSHKKVQNSSNYPKQLDDGGYSEAVVR